MSRANFVDARLLSRDYISRMSAVTSIRPVGFPWATVDPFLFCVHHKDAYPKGNASLGPAVSLEGRRIGMDFDNKDGWNMYHGDKVPGFPQHPHRGFETVTVARRGYIDHSDSLGATARFGKGDCQWMTAGKGIVHCEMFPLLNNDADNPAELFQIWLNLPKKHKMVEPHFTMLWADAIPVVTKVDAAGKKSVVTVTAGPFDGKTPPAPPPHSWAAAPENDVAIWTIAMEPGARLTLPKVRQGSVRSIYVFVGDSASVDGVKVDKGHVARVDDAKAIELIAGAQPVEVLLLQGQPIKEPVVAHGPFVMNTSQEIYAAFTEYQRTRFGGWPWPSDDPTHTRDAGRFARHANGKVESRGM